MKKKKSIITVFVLLAFMPFLFACDNETPNNEIPDDEDTPSISKDEDGSPHPQGSFNYASIAPHPRLLLSYNDELVLKENLKSNYDLAAVHEFIINNCNAMLNTMPSTRIMEGKRLLAVSRTALKRIFYLSYGYRMTGDVRYLNRAERELNAVCDFTDWNPSHFLDVGEMAMGVAIGYDWLFDKLKETTKHNIRKALSSMAFEPSKNKTYNWFLNNDANWNQVCNAGLTFAALATYEGNKTASVGIIERAVESVKLPLKAYGPDGNYSEGYMYWAYGTSFQVLMLAALDSALGSDLDLHKTEGFMKTAEYMLFMSGTNGLCFNYSDSYTKETVNPSMFWFAKKDDNPSLLLNEISLIKNGGAYTRTFEEDRILPSVMAYANLPSFSDAKSPDKKMWVGHGITPVALVRTSWESKETDKYLGVKGGMASTSHGHMDAGSFVYDSDGIRWSSDLGMQSYGALEAMGMDIWNMGQNSERWNVFRLHNKAHSTITINNKSHLVNGKASILEVYDEDSFRGVTMDLSPTLAADMYQVERKIGIVNNEYLQIDDLLKARQSNTLMSWRMLTSSKPTFVDERTIKLESNGKVMFLTIQSELDIVLKTWSTEPTTAYDLSNPGTILVGFESILSAGVNSVFSIKLLPSN